MNATDNTILVFDIGKTHVKVTLLSNDGHRIYQNRTSNKVVHTGEYDGFDVDHIWNWLLREISALTQHHAISAISIATHGAAAALVDTEEEKLLLPIMDYEFDKYPVPLETYKRLRPKFSKTGSPSFPAGLNLGRQLHWLSQGLSNEDKRRVALLLYPQYWSWKLTGTMTSEITSLGCHTDLWDIESGKPSSLLDELGLGNALPPLTPAWKPVGKVKESVRTATGLDSRCEVYPGIHDSNAGYISILKRPKKHRPTVVSSGTWTIVMDANADISCLDEDRDMLVNIDAEGNPLATARFMGGREFALICERLNTDIATTFTDQDIKSIIDANVHVLPSFCQGTGPYPNAKGMINFDEANNDVNGKAAATIYAALMINDVIERISPESKQDILIEGSFASNEVLCKLLAALQPNRNVRIQNQGNGVTYGCYLLTKWSAPDNREENAIIKPYEFDGLSQHAETWKQLVGKL